MKLSDTATKVLESRYLLKNKDGTLKESFDDLITRVAGAVADAELTYTGNAERNREVSFADFYKMMRGLDFLPNSPTLMNAGLPDGQLSACFLLPVDDNIESIFEAVKQMALIFKSGGGVGLPMSRLRQKGAPIKSTGGVSSGPVSFMSVYNTTAEVVAQGGKRRGALMGTLKIDHPDILEFIKVKQDLKTLTSFNVSVAITEEFMRALTLGKLYELIEPHTKKQCGRLSAQEVWDKIVDCAWRTGEPGLIFIDRINEAHKGLIEGTAEIEGTNPCGELPLLPYESCNLGSINLANFVREPFTKKAKVHHDRLALITQDAVRFLDNVITINHLPLPQIENATLATRKIGLGVMGFADMLIKLGAVYGSGNSKDILNDVLHTISHTADETSTKLGQSRGVYPASVKLVSRRNGALTAIAPTGSISMIADVTGGIEPMFAVATRRESVLDGEPFVQVNQTVLDLLKHRGFEDRTIQSILADLADRGDTNLPDEIRDLLVCAHQVSPEDHVTMQSVAQKWSDGAVSKTVNLPNSAGRSDVYAVLLQAYGSGCKGITVYRDGCREHQPMSAVKASAVPSAEHLQQVVRDVYNPGNTVGVDQFPVLSTDAKILEFLDASGQSGDKTPSLDQVREWAKKMDIPIGAEAHLDNLKLHPKERPQVLAGNTVKMKTGCGTLFVTISTDDDGTPVELFAHHGKAGVCSQAQCEAIGRLSSMSLRAGIDPVDVVDQLRGITCHETAGLGPNKVLSCADGIAQAITKALDAIRPKTEGDPKAEYNEVPVFMGGCPKCGAGLIREGGCAVCRACGWNKCS